MNIRNFSSALAVTLMLYTQTVSAKKHEIDFSNKIATITDNKDVRHTGFMAEFNGKKVIFFHADALTDNPDIYSLDGKLIDFQSIILPTDKKRKVIIFQLPEGSKLPTFELQKEIAEKIKPGDRIKTQGMRKDKKKLGGGKGSITKVKEDKIDLRCKVIFDITGAPVVAENTGKVIGIAVSRKKKRFEIPYAIRIDNIDKTIIILKTQVENEISRCKELYSMLMAYSSVFRELNKIIRDSGLDNTKNNFKHLSPETAQEIVKKIKEYIKQLAESEKELSEAITRLKKAPEIKTPGVKRKFKENLNRGIEIVEYKYQAKQKLLEGIVEKLEKRANAIK